MYVGAHAPKRGNENYWWRVYSGEDNTTIDTVPPQPASRRRSTRAVLRVQDQGQLHLQRLGPDHAGAGTSRAKTAARVRVTRLVSDGARRAVPRPLRFRHRRRLQPALRAGGPRQGCPGHPRRRPAGNTVITRVGDYEVADWKISEGTHLAESDAPFGIYQVGYTAVTRTPIPAACASRSSILSDWAPVRACARARAVLPTSPGAAPEAVPMYRPWRLEAPDISCATYGGPLADDRGLLARR